MADCSWWELGCKVGDWASSIVGDAIENMAAAVMEAVGKAIASLGTMWVHIGTPNLTGTGGPSTVTAGSTAPDSENIARVLDYVTWISLVIAVLSLFALGGLIATRIRAGEGIIAVGRLGLILGAVVLISGSTALVSALLPAGPTNAGGAVLFLQSSLWWYMGAAAIISVIVGGARMAWEQRAEPGRELVKSLLTLIVVAGAGVGIVGLLVAAADSFSVWIINSALECDVTADSACFGEGMMNLLALGGASGSQAAGVAGVAVGALLLIILGLVATLASLIQIALMVARGGMLVILTGVLPLAASFTNTEMGKSWFKKAVTWLVAFILYKPAAAIVYAAAFQLVGTNVFGDGSDELLASVTGLMLMLLALVAMPALMRFTTPMVGAVAGGAAGGMAAAGAMAALPTGAAAVSRLASGSGSAGGTAAATAGMSGPSGADGANGSSGWPSPPTPSGPNGSAPAGAGSSSPTGPGSAAPGTGGTPASTPAGDGAGSGGGAAAAAASGGAPTGAATGHTISSNGGYAGNSGAGGAVAGVTPTGAAAGGGAAAAGAAAAGPAGSAAGAAWQAGQVASGAARNVGEQAAGEEDGGPDGSRR